MYISLPNPVKDQGNVCISLPNPDKAEAIFVSRYHTQIKPKQYLYLVTKPR